MPRPRSAQDLQADYVIVGAGSAGCVLANRLSADPRTRVVIVEAGGDDRVWASPKQVFTNLNVRIPAGWTRAMTDPAITWGYRSEPDPSAGNRRFTLARGRVLGGSSSINGMTYVRGLPEDYDDWRQLGCDGWGWDDVLPYFRAAERQQRGGDAWHGAEGPMTISDAPFRHPMSERMRAAFQEAGVPATEDVNGPHPEGVTYAQAAIHRGRRHSGAAAYLHPVRRRPNLKVLTETMTLRVSIENRRAAGVEVLHHKERRFIRANAAVILAAGAINSPQLLQLSGIGDPDLLRACGVPVVHAAPGVGADLQDHYSSNIQIRLRSGVPSLNSRSKGWRLARELLRYALIGDGLLAAGASQLTALARSRPELDLPDVQYFSSPATVDLAATAAAGRVVLEDVPGTTIGLYPLRPRSRGHVRIRSSSPLEPPAIVTNYLSDPADEATMLSGLRLARRIAAQPALAPFVENGAKPELDNMTDDEVLDYARNTGNTAFHYSGTCRMGAADAVLTPRLAVRGIDGLRVADASVMPRLVSGNTNAAVVMIAEKASRMILEDS